MKVKAFTNCNLLNVKDGSFASNCTVIVNGSIIVDVGQLSLPIESELEVINLQGLWGIPGIIDLHVHTCEETDPQIAADFICEESEIYTGLRASKNLKEAVTHGVTTLRDVGAYAARNIQVKRAVEKGIIIGPNVYACGYLITYPEGHICNRGLQVRGVEQVRAAIEKNVELGADFIKVTNDPEDTEVKGRTPDPTLTPEEFTTLVEEAHKHGLKVACHTFPSIKGINNALDAGVDTLEHAVPLNEEILDRFLSQKVIIVPTFTAGYDEFSTDFVSEKISLDKSRANKYRVTNYPPGSLSPLRPQGVPESIVIWFDYLIKYLPIAIKNNVQIGIGSDAGCAGTNFRSAIREMFLLTQLGATNLQVIQYATLNGANALGSDKLGMLAPAKQADLIFLRQNPVESLDSLLDMELVVSRGNIVSDFRQHEQRR